MGFLQKFFSRFRVIQVEVPKSLKLTESQGKAALATLVDHPGFNHLLDKIRLQAALLDSQLKYRTHTDIREVDKLQAMAAGIRWVESVFVQAVNAPEKQQPREPNAEELEALERGLKMIEFVGQ